MSHTKPPRIIRVILAGDTSVGKTSIYKKYIHNKFNEDEKSTLNMDFMTKTLPLNQNNEQTMLQLWDTNSIVRFTCSFDWKHLFSGNADCVIFVYDVTNPQSFYYLFEEMKEFMECRNQKDAEACMNPITCMIMGNKIDLDYVKFASDSDMEIMFESCACYSVLNTENVINCNRPLNVMRNIIVSGYIRQCQILVQHLIIPKVIYNECQQFYGYYKSNIIHALVSAKTGENLDFAFNELVNLYDEMENIKPESSKEKEINNENDHETGVCAIKGCIVL
eukprot:246801_1